MEQKVCQYDIYVQPLSRYDGYGLIIYFDKVCAYWGGGGKSLHYAPVIALHSEI